MTRHLVAVLSDPHLSPGRAYAVPGWRACVAAVAEARPDLTVLLGDLLLDDPDDATDRAFAAACLVGLNSDRAAIPGNHDVGDNGAEPHLGEGVTTARLAGWRATFGADRFALPLGEWSLIGVNAQLLGTGAPEEAEAWAWLEEVLQDAGSRPVALFTHKPLFWRSLADEDGGNHWPSACRERLRAMFGRGRLRLVVSGHLHQHRVAVEGAVTHLWCPSTGMPGRDHGFGSVTSRQPGLTFLEFEGDRVSFAVVPSGIGGPDFARLRATYGAFRNWPLLSEPPSEPS